MKLKCVTIREVGQKPMFCFQNKESKQILTFNSKSTWDNIAECQIDLREGFSSEAVDEILGLIPKEFDIENILEIKEAAKQAELYNNMTFLEKVEWLKTRDKSKYKLHSDYDYFWVAHTNEEVQEELEDSECNFISEEWGYKQLMDLFSVLNIW